MPLGRTLTLKCSLSRSYPSLHRCPNIALAMPPPPAWPLATPSLVKMSTRATAFTYVIFTNGASLGSRNNNARFFFLPRPPLDVVALFAVVRPPLPT